MCGCNPSGSVAAVVGGLKGAAGSVTRPRATRAAMRSLTVLRSTCRHHPDIRQTTAVSLVPHGRKAAASCPRRHPRSHQSLSRLLQHPGRFRPNINRADPSSAANARHRRHRSAVKMPRMAMTAANPSLGGPPGSATAPRKRSDRSRNGSVSHFPAPSLHFRALRLSIEPPPLRCPCRARRTARWRHMDDLGDQGLQPGQCFCLVLLPAA